jgi:hypothetical protein
LAARFDLPDPTRLVNEHLQQIPFRLPYREDPQLFALATVPVHLDSLPGGIRTLCPALQAPLALSLGGFGAILAWGLRPRPMIQLGIVPQAEDHDHVAFDTRQGQRDRAKPPSTTGTSRRPGSLRRTCFTICRIQSTLILCRCRFACPVGRHSVSEMPEVLCWITIVQQSPGQTRYPRMGWTPVRS